MNIAIIDYNAGNLRNVQKALESLGANATIVSSSEGVAKSDALLLPGVGSFREGMLSIHKAGLYNTLRVEVEENKKPILGICLGMQLLGRSSEEGGETLGLDLLPMDVMHFDTQRCTECVPHMGWNNVSLSNKSSLLRDIPDNTDFYFAHSYHVTCLDESIIVGTCDYGYSFTAAIQKDNIFATQFHPEKSHRFGYSVLNNFLDYCFKRN